MTQMATQIAGHRGASKAFRENTLDAFTGALAMGAHMVELDVRRTADGQMIVHHDAHIETKGPIVNLRADELPGYVPSLEQALNACAGMDVNVEIKSDAREPDHDPDHWLAQAVVELLVSRSDAARMIVSSFDRSCIDRVRELAPQLRTGFLYVMPLPSIDEIIETTRAGGHVAIHPHHAGVNEDVVTKAHRHGLAVNVWTIDDLDRIRELADIGVDTIITNVPDLALAAVLNR
jgi:glycerophosphoryl diester phosphodiesterase